MSNRGGENGSGGRVAKKNKNIYGPTHWASGWEGKEQKPCVGISMKDLTVVAAAHVQPALGKTWEKEIRNFLWSELFK